MIRESQSLDADVLLLSKVQLFDPSPISHTQLSDHVYFKSGIFNSTG